MLLSGGTADLYPSMGFAIIAKEWVICSTTSLRGAIMKVCKIKFNWNLKELMLERGITVLSHLRLSCSKSFCLLPPPPLNPRWDYWWEREGIVNRWALFQKVNTHFIYENNRFFNLQWSTMKIHQRGSKEFPSDG